MNQRILQAMTVLLACLGAHAQVNSGSNGSDGAFNPTTNIVINMADHPSGIYQYTSVNISNGVSVTFIPNANNTPVVWLVQSNCTIGGTVNVSGRSLYQYQLNGLPAGSDGGPGGWAGGNGGTTATGGLGPGGGNVSQCGCPSYGQLGGNASFGTVGSRLNSNPSSLQGSPGAIYGNVFLVPLVGGSGGAGNSSGGNGGGGGGAIVIAANGVITLNGQILANGGSVYTSSYQTYSGAGAGSGGAVRLLATTLAGSGSISAVGGGIYTYNGYCCDYVINSAGNGRVRFDALQNSFNGSINGVFSQGFQPIIIQTNGQGAQLTLASVGGVPVSASPSGQLATPDAVLSAQQNNPIPIVVHCSNIPLNTQITVSVKPATGATVSATGLNNTGTPSSSTATVLINMPRGGGIIYATAATGN